MQSTKSKGKGKGKGKGVKKSKKTGTQTRAQAKVAGNLNFNRTYILYLFVSYCITFVYLKMFNFDSLLIEMEKQAEEKKKQQPPEIRDALSSVARTLVEKCKFF